MHATLPTDREGTIQGSGKSEHQNQVKVLYKQSQTVIINKISLFVMESAVLIGTSRGLAVNNDHGLYMETEWIHTVSVIILYLWLLFMF